MESRVHSVKPSFVEMAELGIGGKVLFATDDWFATAENLLQEHSPQWKEDEHDQFGKWMDGWETRRRRIPGHDFCIIRLRSPGIISGFDVDTSFFTGNHPPKVSIQAAVLLSKGETGENAIPERIPGNGKGASPHEMKVIESLKSDDWETIVPKTTMGPGNPSTCHNYCEVTHQKLWSHVRLNLFPDGGIARLRIYGQVKKQLRDIIFDEEGFMDLVALENGSICTGFSDCHYGHPRNLTKGTAIKNTCDGWQTARRLDRPEILELENGILQFAGGNEWAAFRLAFPGTIYKVEVETTLFKGNYPDSCQLEGCLVPDDTNTGGENNAFAWKVLLPFKKVLSLESIGIISHVRLTMIPDGGIARLRVWGRPDVEYD